MAFPFTLTTPTEGSFELLDASGTIVPAMGGPGGSGPPPALLVTDWWVDPVAGDNANDGLTPGTAVKTVMGGIVPKWETTAPVLPQSVTIHFLNDETPGQELISLVITMTGVGSMFSMLGEYRQVNGPTTLAAVTPKNRGGGVLLAVTLTDAFAPQAGQFVNNTDKGSRAPVYVNGGTMCQPLTSFALGAPFAPPSEDDSWAPGDACVVERPLNVNVISITVIGAGTFNCQALKWIDPSGVVGSTFSAFRSFDSGSQDTFIDWQVETLHFCTTTNLLFMTSCLELGNSELFWGETGAGDFVILGGAYQNPLGNTPGGIPAAGGIFFDSDVILAPQGVAEFGGSVLFGLVYITTPVVPIFLFGQMVTQPFFNGSNIIWGNGGIGMRQGGKAFMGFGGTWAGTWQSSGAMSIDGGGPAAAFNRVTGAWTAGININPANVDANDGLCNPVTGSAWTFLGG